MKVNGVSDESMDCGTNDSKTLRNLYGPAHSFNPTFGSMPPAPPLPPQLMARLAKKLKIQIYLHFL